MSAAPNTPPTKRVVLTIGTFDGLHAGHVRMLENAARFGTLHVGVNSDRFVRQFKGEPLFTETDRLATVRAVGCVYDVHLNDGPGVDLIRKLNPTVLAVGPDWLNRDYLAQIGMPDDQLFQMGATLAFLPPARTTSLASSRLR